jgi:hypothetical protein
LSFFVDKTAIGCYLFVHEIQILMHSEILVTPAKAGVQRLYNYLNELDSGFRRNDEKEPFRTICEFIKYHRKEIIIHVQLYTGHQGGPGFHG